MKDYNPWLNMMRGELEMIDVQGLKGALSHIPFTFQKGDQEQTEETVKTGAHETY